MTIIYGRQARVTFRLSDGDGLTISEPRIRFAIDRTVDRTQDRGVVQIYNLNDQNAAVIRDRGEAVTLEAGYRLAGGLAEIMVGRLQEVRNLRHNLARITAVDVGDEIHAVRRLRGIYNRSYRGHVNVRQIVRDIVERGLGLSIAQPSLDLIPQGATFYNFVWSSAADAALSTLLNSDSCCGLSARGCSWYEEDGFVRINRPGELQPDSTTVDTSPETGLLGIPTRTDEGAQATMLLNPRVRLGSRLNITSKALSGPWKVVGIRHEGDTWATGRGSSFRTLVELRRLAA